MALPKLTVRLFPPKPGRSYSGSGSLTIPLADVHALAEWLFAQSGEFDHFLKDNVVRLLAFEYQNRSRSGNTYRTVQLRDPADFDGGPSRQPYPTPDTHSPGGFNNDDVPF